jgi:hypothetical protein
MANYHPRDEQQNGRVSANPWLSMPDWEKIADASWQRPLRT